MNIIHLISGGDAGGAKTHVHSMLRNLSKAINITLVCFRSAEFSDEAIQLGIPTVVIEGSFISSFLRLKKLVAEGGYDIIHCHGARGNLMGALLKLFLHLPVISTVHSDYRLDYLGRPLAHFTYGVVNAVSLRIADYLVGVSESMKKLLISRGFRPNDIFTIYNGVDFTQEAVISDRREYFKRIGFDAGDGCVVVGIAARLNPVKDVATLIRGFAYAYGENNKLRLLIVGDGSESERLRRLSDELGLQNAVCFAGWQTDIGEFYSSIDINTLTSISETFPYALTESALYRIPAVSSRVGGIPELIRHGDTGMLFTAGDYQTLGSHLLTLADDASMRKRLGENLYAVASRDFSMEASWKRQLEIYNTVLSRRGGASRNGVLICGAYGHGNAGDEAILDAIIRDMKGIDPRIPITVLSRRPSETMQNFGVDALYTFNIPAFIREMRRTKLFINGGGSLIQDVTSRRSLWFYLLTLYAAKKLGNGVIMYGCGIGPVSRSYNRGLVKRVLNRYVDVITLRESHSKGELDAFGVTRPRVIVSCDPALSLKAADYNTVSEAMRGMGLDPDGKYACFMLRRWRNFSRKIPDFREAARYASLVYGLTPVFLSINSRNDSEASALVVSGLDVPYHIIRDPLESSLTIGVIARMKLAVSMRLHGLIFAAGQGVPLVGISYDPKVSAFFDYIGQDLRIDFDDVSADVLKSLMDTAMLRAGASGIIAEQAEKLREISYLNAEAARRLLG